MDRTRFCNKFLKDRLEKTTTKNCLGLLRNSKSEHFINQNHNTINNIKIK